MVTKTEKDVRKELIEDGFFCVHCGAPDFLCFKKTDMGKITDIKFVEVKGNINEKLRKEQETWRTILEALNLKYELIYRIEGKNITKPRHITKYKKPDSWLCRLTIEIRKHIIKQMLEKNPNITSCELVKYFESLGFEPPHENIVKNDKRILETKYA